MAHVTHVFIVLPEIQKTKETYAVFHDDPRKGNKIDSASFDIFMLLKDIIGRLEISFLDVISQSSCSSCALTLTVSSHASLSHSDTKYEPMNSLNSPGHQDSEYSLEQYGAGRVSLVAMLSMHLLLLHPNQGKQHTYDLSLCHFIQH